MSAAQQQSGSIKDEEDGSSATLVVESSRVIPSKLPTLMQQHCRRLLRNDPTLVKINLSHFELMDAGGVALGSALRNNTHLQELVLHDNMLCREGSVAIFEGLQAAQESGNCSLKSLIWGGNMMGKHGATALGKVLCGEHVSIEEMLIVNEDIGDGDEGLFQQGLAHNKSLRILHLAEMESNDNWNSLGVALSQNDTLEALDLGKNRIADNINAIARGLRQNRGLKRVDLRRNNIGSFGAASLGVVLEFNETLEDLNLFGNQIGNGGAAVISRWGLRWNRTLVKLDLTLNDIGNYGATRLASCLGESALAELHLSSNNIGSEGATAIAHSLVQNTTLRELYLSCNEIGVTGMKALLETARNHNKTIRCLLVNNQRSQVASRGQLHALEKEIDFFLRLHEAGYQYIGNVSIPMSLWPVVLERASHQADVLYWFLLAKPELMKTRTN